MKPSVVVVALLIWYVVAWGVLVALTVGALYTGDLSVELRLVWPGTAHAGEAAEQAGVERVEWPPEVREVHGDRRLEAGDGFARLVL